MTKTAWKKILFWFVLGHSLRTISQQIGISHYSVGQNHINGLEGFWGYLKRKLAAKGGVKRKYPHLFLGEYVWRYNYRSLGAEKQVNRLLNKIINFSG